QRPGGAGVIEVDVREQHRAQIADAYSRLAQPGPQHRQRRRGARVDERGPAGAVEDDGRDDPRHAEEVQVEIRKPGRKCFHERLTTVDYDCDRRGRARPGPRNAFPGRSSVILPSATTRRPLTITCCTPTE